MLEKGLDNPNRYYVSINWNQIEISNGITSVLVSIDRRYYTYLQFNESVDLKLIKVLALISMESVMNM